MDQDVLKVLGQTAGLGGIALGVFLLLFREVIRKRIFPTLTKQQSFRIIVLFLVLVWSVAIVGTGAWLWVETRSPEFSGEEQPGAGAGVSPVESMDEEVAFRVSTFKSLIVDGEVNDRVMSDLQTVFESTAPGDQDYMIGGSRFLHSDFAFQNLAALLLSLRSAAPPDRRLEIETALAATNDFHQMILAEGTREVKISSSVIDDVPDFDGADVLRIQSEIIPGFRRWLE